MHSNNNMGKTDTVSKWVLSYKNQKLGGAHTRPKNLNCEHNLGDSLSIHITHIRTRVDLYATLPRQMEDQADHGGLSQTDVHKNVKGLGNGAPGHDGQPTANQLRVAAPGNARHKNSTPSGMFCTQRSWISNAARGECTGCCQKPHSYTQKCGRNIGALPVSATYGCSPQPVATACAGEYVDRDCERGGEGCHPQASHLELPRAR